MYDNGLKDMKYTNKVYSALESIDLLFFFLFCLKSVFTFVQGKSTYFNGTNNVKHCLTEK